MSAAHETHPRRQDVSAELSEVRTVLSRAETAAGTLRSLRRLRERDTSRLHGPLDPDADEMVEAMERVVAELDRWRGKRTRRAARWQ